MFPAKLYLHNWKITKCTRRFYNVVTFTCSQHWIALVLCYYFTLKRVNNFVSLLYDWRETRRWSLRLFPVYYPSYNFKQNNSLYLPLFALEENRKDKIDEEAKLYNYIWSTWLIIYSKCFIRFFLSCLTLTYILWRRNKLLQYLYSYFRILFDFNRIYSLKFKLRTAKET